MPAAARRTRNPDNSTTALSIDHMRALGAQVIDDAILRAGFEALARAVEQGDLKAFELAIRLLYGPIPTLRKSAAAALTSASPDLVRVYLPYDGGGEAPDYVEDGRGQIKPARTR